MSPVLSDRVDLLIDLYHPSLSWQCVHEGLEALDAAGYVPQHLWTIPEATIARIEYELEGTLGAKILGGGAWLIEAKSAHAPTFRCGEAGPDALSAQGEERLVGVIGYQGKEGLRRLPRLLCGEPDVGYVGPVFWGQIAERHQVTLLVAVLHSLRERGYRRAVLPDLTSAMLPVLTQTWGSALLAVLPRSDAVAVRPRVVICASGNGSNLQAVIDATATGRLDLDLCGVIVNREHAFALERARRSCLPTHSLVWQRSQQSRSDYDRCVHEAIAAAKPDLILLLGWMHLLPEYFMADFPGMLNVHPAYLPLDPSADVVALPDGSTQEVFRGAKSLEAAYTAGAAWVGATVHRVTAEMDRGEVLARRPLPRTSDETLSELQARVHQAEHAILIEALESWCATSLERLE